MLKVYLYVLLGVLSTTSFMIKADELSSFIESSYVPVFDCPAADMLPKIEKHLASPNLTFTQKSQLTVRKTHVQICLGQSRQAQITLQSLLGNNEADRTARYYTVAIYQYAFIYDTQENSEKCNYYRLARDTAEKRFPDVHASANMAYLIGCLMDIPLEEKMVMIYTLLEDLIKIGNKAALANAHNNVGLFYGDMGANSLGATQYLKAYEIGKDIYTYENQVPILANAMTALILSDDVVRAQEVLTIFKEVAAKSQSDFVNFYLYYSEASLAIHMNDFDALESVLAKWRVYQEAKKRSVVSNGLFRWYSSALCLHRNDRKCLEEFIVQEESASQVYIGFVSKSPGYLLFMTKVYIFLEDYKAAMHALQKYSGKVKARQQQIEDNKKNFSAANLHSKVLNLESKLANQNSFRNKVLIALVGLLLVIAIALIWVLRRKLLKSKSIDSTTGLLNSAAVISKITRLPAPGEKRTNALAIFDIANFTEVNLSLGSSKGDYVLHKLADTFRKITRNSDVLGRFGPEQFILCLADIEEEAAQAFFERTKEALANTFKNDHNGSPISVDSSMSIYYENGTFNDINEILDNMLLSLSMKSTN